MYSEIVAAIQSTKAAIELVKAAKDLSNYSELLTAVTAIQIKLADAVASELASQEKRAELLERIRNLEKDLEQVKGWSAQMERYALFAFPTGALAYALSIQEDSRPEPMHYLCVACVDKKQRSTLQPNGRHLYCVVCKTSVMTESPAPSNPMRGTGSWGGLSPNPLFEPTRSGTAQIGLHFILGQFALRLRGRLNSTTRASSDFKQYSAGVDREAIDPGTTVVRVPTLYGISAEERRSRVRTGGTTNGHLIAAVLLRTLMKDARGGLSR